MNGTILRYRGFRLLLAGLAVSQAGDWLYNLALITLVYQRTHSPMWAGITTAARVVPMVALGPFGGIVAGRFDRRRTMIACDVIRMALMGVLALVAVANLPVVAAPLIAAAATAAAAPYLPAVSATTPRLVADADLPAANAVRSAVTGIGIIVGPALGGVLLLLGSPALAFVLNAVTFGLSALAVLAIPCRAAFQPAWSAWSTLRPAGVFHGVFRGVFREVADGAAVLRAHPQTMRLVGAAPSAPGLALRHTGTMRPSSEGLPWRHGADDEASAELKAAASLNTSLLNPADLNSPSSPGPAADYHG